MAAGDAGVGHLRAWGTAGTGEPGSGVAAARLSGALVRGWGLEGGVRVQLLGFGGLLGWLGLVFAQLASRLASQSDPARLGSAF